ncbi:hypothetical protein SHIRM173S_07636 [Streptomyces hirsutus]
MLQRGVIVSYETIRRWCAKFGQAYANGLRRHRPRTGDKWHLDEVFIKINGGLKYLWRAVDQDGTVLDILVQSRRDKAAARRFFRRLLKKTRAVSRVIVTDKLRSYGAAHREVMPSVEHRSHQGLNNRAENSRQPTRQRERGHERLPLRRRSPAVPVRVQRHLTPLPPSPPPDDRPRPPRRDDRPLRPLGPDHRRCWSAHHGLTPGPKRRPTTPRRAIRHSHTQQRDSAAARQAGSHNLRKVRLRPPGRLPPQCGRSGGPRTPATGCLAAHPGTENLFRPRPPPRNPEVPLGPRAFVRRTRVLHL